MVFSLLTSLPMITSNKRERARRRERGGWVTLAVRVPAELRARAAEFGARSLLSPTDVARVALLKHLDEVAPLGAATQDEVAA